MHIERLVTAGVLALLTACAAAPNQMEILVDTSPPGASCRLERQGQAIATAAPTPAIALVAASEAEITVHCRRNGFADAVATLHPRPQAPTFGPLFAPAPGPYEQRVDIALIPR
jgi:hypothetical protein